MSRDMIHFLLPIEKISPDIKLLERFGKMSNAKFKSTTERIFYRQ